MPMSHTAGRALAALAAAALLSLTSAGCKNSSSTSTSTLSTIIITNACGADLKIYSDGVERTTITAGSSATLSSVPAGQRLLEAKKADDGFLVYSQTLTILPSTANYVSIRGGASVRVTNQSGQILRIYDDTNLVGDIGDQITQTIKGVGFGSHPYRAEKLSDGTVVAEFTIEVTNFSQYTWTITP